MNRSFRINIDNYYLFSVRYTLCKTNQRSKRFITNTSLLVSHHNSYYWYIYLLT